MLWHTHISLFSFDSTSDDKGEEDDEDDADEDADDDADEVVAEEDEGTESTPACRPHILIVLSPPQVAKAFPLGDHAQHHIRSVCPFNSATTVNVADDGHITATEEDENVEHAATQRADCEFD